MLLQVSMKYINLGKLTQHMLYTTSANCLCVQMHVKASSMRICREGSDVCVLDGQSSQAEEVISAGDVNLLFF